MQIRKIIKYVTFAAGVFVLSKLLGIIIANNLYDLRWYIKSTEEGIYNISLNYVTNQQVLSAIKVSTVVNMIFVGLGTTYFLIKAYWLHSSHQTPRNIVILQKLQMHGLVSNSISIFTQLFIWLFFQWTIVVLAIYDAINDLLSWNIIIVGAVITLLQSTLFLIDIEREIKLSKTSNEKSA